MFRVNGVNMSSSTEWLVWRMTHWSSFCWSHLHLAKRWNQEKSILGYSQVHPADCKPKCGAERHCFWHGWKGSFIKCSNVKNLLLKFSFLSVVMFPWAFAWACAIWNGQLIKRTWNMCTVFWNNSQISQKCFYGLIN